MCSVLSTLICEGTRNRYAESSRWCLNPIALNPTNVPGIGESVPVGDHTWTGSRPILAKCGWRCRHQRVGNSEPGSESTTVDPPALFHVSSAFVQHQRTVSRIPTQNKADILGNHRAQIHARILLSCCSPSPPPQSPFSGCKTTLAKLWTFTSPENVSENRPQESEVPVRFYPKRETHRSSHVCAPLQPRSGSRTPSGAALNRLITAKDHASVQINVADVDESGRAIPGQSTTFAFCGAVRSLAESDDSLNRLATESGCP